ncbi:MAG: SIMPL domain-containing protein [Planctomycetota bacterium]
MPLALAIFLILAVPSTAWAQPPARDTPHIRVTGIAITSVKPDFLEWKVGVSDRADQSTQAKAENDRKIAALLALRDLLNIAPDDIEAGTVSVQRARKKNPLTNQWEDHGYRVTRTVVIRQRDLKQFDAFLSAFTSENHAVSMTPRVTAAAAIRRETELKALDHAKEKAAAWAHRLGAELAEPLQISRPGDSFDDYEHGSAFGDIEAGDANGAGYVPGDIRFVEEIEVVFALAPAEPVDSGGGRDE